MFRRSVGDTSKQPYFHLSACRRSSGAGIQSAIQGEWVFTRRIEDCAKPPAPGVSQAAPLSNLVFMAASSLLVIAVGWYLTDRVVEPRLRATAIDGDPDAMPKMKALTADDRRGFRAGAAALAAGLGLLALAMLPCSSPLRAEDGSLTSDSAPLMHMLVPLIFVLFIVPGVVHGYVAGTVRNHREIVTGMTAAMHTMSYYLVMVFFAAQFLAVFNDSNIGLLIALKGANLLRDLNFFPPVTIVGIVLLTAVVNLFVGSASAKWALLSSIFVPMLMDLGIAPELTQAAYRVGDSVTNIVTPLMPYFPLVVAFSQRYVKSTGIGTVVSLMLPYSAVLVRRERRHSSAGANPARQLSLQPVAVGADDGGNDIGRSTPTERAALGGSATTRACARLTDGRTAGGSPAEGRSNRPPSPRVMRRSL